MHSCQSHNMAVLWLVNYSKDAPYRLIASFSSLAWHSIKQLQQCRTFQSMDLRQLNEERVHKQDWYRLIQPWHKHGYTWEKWSRGVFIQNMGAKSDFRHNHGPDSSSCWSSLSRWHPGPFLSSSAVLTQGFHFFPVSFIQHMHHHCILLVPSLHCILVLLYLFSQWKTVVFMLCQAKCKELTKKNGNKDERAEWHYQKKKFIRYTQVR